MSNGTAARPHTTPEAHGHALRGAVLLAADGQARSDATGLVARRVAERLGVPVEVAAALEPLSTHAIGYGTLMLPPEVEDDRRAGLRDAVRNQLAPILGPPDGWRLEIRHGALGRVVADVARERRAGLIVVASGDHGLVARLLGEEVALQVIRHATVPVLVIAPVPAAPIRAAVVGVDFSAASIRAARFALALLDPAPGEPGRLTLVHVRPPDGGHVALPVAWASNYEANVQGMFARLREQLAPGVRDDVALETRVRAGDVAEQLVAAARETDADLVAVGTHGPGWVERLLVGSVATATVRHAGRAVLVAPAPAAGERVRLELPITGQVALARADDWASALEGFTRRNRGRRARLEVTGEEAAGFVVDAEWSRFAGATFDPDEGRVEIRLDDETDRRRHLTHGVRDVRSVEIAAGDDRRAHTLVIEHAQGHIVLTFAD